MNFCPVVETHSLALSWDYCHMIINDPHYVFSTFNAVAMPLEKEPRMEIFIKTQPPCRMAKLKITAGMIRHFFSKYMPSDKSTPDQVKFKIGDDPKFFYYSIFDQLIRTLARFYYNYCCKSDSLAVLLMIDFPAPGANLSLRLPPVSELAKGKGVLPLVRNPTVSIVIDDD